MWVAVWVSLFTIIVPTTPRRARDGAGIDQCRAGDDLDVVTLYPPPASRCCSGSFLPSSSHLLVTLMVSVLG
jgi:hypothetical protein